MKIPQQVVELEGFIKAAAKLLSPEDVGELIVYLGFHPEAGDLIKGTGGFRKLRWARQGMGKRGGTRVIYFFCNENFPAFLADIYAKGDREDLTQKDRNRLAKISARILDNY